MPAPPDALRGCSLLAVFAHPDDESLASGGLIARCADLGAQVSLLCVTHGQSICHKRRTSTANDHDNATSAAATAIALSGVGMMGARATLNATI